MDISYVKQSLHKTETSHVTNLDGNNKDPLIVVQYPQIDKTVLPSPYQIDTYPLALILTKIKGKLVLITSSYNTSTAINDLISDSSKYKFKLDTCKDLSLAIIYEITQDYKETIDKLNSDTLAIEADLSSATDNNVMYQIMSLIKSSEALSIALQSNKPVIQNILKDTQYFNSNNYNDLANLINSEFEQSEENTDYLKSVLNSYSNLVSSIISNNSNTIMSTLTKVTVVLSIISAIAGTFSMNYIVPFAHLSDSFYYMVIFMLLASYATLKYLKHKHIL